MKNVKRILLLITLILVASKILFSGEELLKPESNVTTVVVNN